jgi:hypothetical protein
MDADKNSAGKNREWKEELERNYFEEENIFFYPPESGKGMNSKKIEHLNLNEITKTENPFCIEIADGRAKMIIQKNYGELSVRVLRE